MTTMTTTATPCSLCGSAHDALGLIGCAASVQRRVAAIESEFSNLDAATIAKQVASEIDLSALAQEFDRDEVLGAIAEEIGIDAASVAESLDASDVAEHVSTSDIAGEIDLSDLAGYLDASEIASNIEIDYSDLADRTADRIARRHADDLVAHLDSESETAKMTRENDEEITRLRDRVEHLEGLVAKLLAVVGIETPEARASRETDEAAVRDGLAAPESIGLTEPPKSPSESSDPDAGAGI